MKRINTYALDGLVLMTQYNLSHPKTNIKIKQMNTLVEACQNVITILGLQWSAGKIWEHVRR
jgi:hypothetical protein